MDFRVTKTNKSKVLILILVLRSSIKGQMASITLDMENLGGYFSSYNLLKIDRIYYFVLLLVDFFNWLTRPSIQIGCFVRIYSLLIIFEMFCLSAILLSESLYAKWGTINYRLIPGINKSSSIIFNEIRATLKFPSPKSLTNVGMYTLINESISNISLLD